MYKKNNTQWHISTVISNRGHEPHHVITRFRQDLGHHEIMARFHSYEAAQAALTAAKKKSAQKTGG